jgi:prevent-host-death family protein
MRPSTAVKSISVLKARAAEILREVSERRGTIVITQNGEAKAVLQDVREWEELQESLALLKILAQSRKSVQAGRVAPLDVAMRRVRRRVRRRSA